MISFIVPAHNEQAYLGGTLRAIHESARTTGKPYEIIVVDDASTDATAGIARENGARVVSVNHRQIAATRNSGGRAAVGGRLFFVDADTTINGKAVVEALRQMDCGAVGGGGPVWFGKEETVPLYIRLVMCVQIVIAKLAGFTGGAFMFCTREAFAATGGFNDRLYWAEEGDFALALKREGRFAVLWKTVNTSGRRFRSTSGLHVLALCARAIVMPHKLFTRRSSVQKIWYESDRQREAVLPNSLVTRVSNTIGLVILLIMLTGPVWNFIPWSWTPLGSFPGTVRFLIAMFLCHLGLLFWPFGLILLRNLLRQKRWTSLVHSTVLIAICIWQGWGCTLGVIWIWTSIGHWVVG